MTTNNSVTQGVVGSRRVFLRGLAGTAAAASFGEAFGLGGAGAPAPGRATSVLDLAATAEAVSVTLYAQVLGRASFFMNDRTRRDLRGVLAAEDHHLALLRSLGGRPLASSFSLPARVLTDAGVFADAALHLEDVSTSAYLGATHQLAAAGQPELAATMAQFAASEAQHLTLLSQLSGYGPFRDTLPTAASRGAADSSPVLARYLKPGVALPSEADVLALLGGDTVPRGKPFVQVYPPAKRR
ncbi:ferritin-like domain-containing protein [Deinococcus sp. VB343]|uniref:Ferritin-like domain-containing protein n=1 Tax=Deinococcus sp. VB142 TaxID=3112952 RepID=A0AAU6Q6S0_9DEIO